MIRSILAAASGVFLVGTIVSGCGSKSDSGGDSQASSQTGYAAEPACSVETRATPYSAGMSETAADGMVVTIDNAVPAPPRIGQPDPTTRKYNQWTMSVRAGLDGGIGDAGPGQLIPNATLKITPYMPDHGHGSPVNNVVTPQGDGTYSVRDLDFSMQGFWDVTVAVTVGGTTEQVIFPLCVD